MLHVSVAGRSAPISVAVQDGQDNMTCSLAQGQPVWLTWKDDAFLVLDAD
jgi:hypothetical protein